MDHDMTSVFIWERKGHRDRFKAVFSSENRRFWRPRFAGCIEEAGESRREGFLGGATCGGCAGDV